MPASLIAESRRETAALYNICSELARNTSELARDRAVMYEILQGLNEDRVRTAENLATIATQMTAQNDLLGRIADALENQN